MIDDRLLQANIMSNPFDDDDDDDVDPSNGPGGFSGPSPAPIPSSSLRYQQQQPHPHNRPTRSSSSTSQTPQHHPSSKHKLSQQPTNSTSYELHPTPDGQNHQQPPIWAARGVEWPLPSTLNPPSYRKLRRESKACGTAMGISGSGLKLDGYSSANQNDGSEKGGSKISRIGRGDIGGDYASVGGEGGGSSGIGTNLAESKGGVGGVGDAGEGSADSSSGGSGGANVAVAGATSGGYGGLTGLMGRVLGASSATASAGGASLISEWFYASLFEWVLLILLWFFKAYFMFVATD